jgi:hypothetical protein
MRRLSAVMNNSTLSIGLPNVSLTIPMSVLGPAGGGAMVARWAPTDDAASVTANNNNTARTFAMFGTAVAQRCA